MHGLQEGKVMDKTKEFMNCPYCQAYIKIGSRDPHVRFNHPQKFKEEQESEENYDRPTVHICSHEHPCALHG